MRNQQLRPLGIDSNFSEPLLSPDLEWMLRSNQANAAMIVEAIIRDYYPALYRLAYSILDDVDQARQCLDEALLVVADKTHHEFGDLSVQVWLYSIVVSLCFEKSRWKRFAADKNRKSGSSGHLSGGTGLWQCIDNLSLMDRLIIVLYYDHQLTTPEISCVLNLEERVIETQVIGLRTDIMEYLQVIPDRSFLLGPFLQEAFHTRWPALDLDEATRELLIAKIVAAIHSLRNRLKISAITMQILLAGGMFFLIAAMSLLTTQLAEKSPRSIVVRTVLVTRIISATPIGQSSSSVHITPPPTLLGESATFAEVIARMQESRQLWSTLWVDGQIIEYGPPGYTGFPFARREQIWIDQPEKSLVLSGWASGDVDRLRYSVHGLVSEKNIRRNQVTVSESPPGQISLESAFESSVFPELFELTSREYQVVGSDQISGRICLILEGHRENKNRYERIWVDASSGVILRRQLFASDGVSLLHEIVVRKIVYDALFPEEIFDPNDPIQHFSNNYFGQPLVISDDYPSPRRTPAPGHRRLPRTTPPGDLDLSNNLPLQFQWNRLPAADFIPTQIQGQNRAQEYGDDIPVSVFIGRYFLGQVEFNPWEARCVRSGDGNSVAVISLTGNRGAPRYQLHWFRLDEIDGSSKLALDISSGGFPLAFDREGKRLMFYACSEDGNQGGCGLYLADLGSRSYAIFNPANQVFDLEGNVESTSFDANTLGSINLSACTSP